MARNATSTYVHRLLLGLSVLVLTPYLFRQLGLEGFGTWSVIFTAATVFSLVEIGFSLGLTKLVAELHSQGRRRELAEAVGAGVSAMVGLGLVMAGLAAVLALAGSGLASPGERDAFRIGLLVVAGAMLVRFPCVAYAGALLGYQRYDLVWMARAAGVLVFSVGAVGAVEAGTGIVGVSVAYAAGQLVDAALYAVCLLRVDPEASLRPRLGDRALRRGLVSFSSYALLADSMVFIGQRMDTLVIAAIRGAAAAAPYAAAVKLQTALQSLTLPITNMLMPMVSDLWSSGRRDEVRRRFALATRVVVQVTLPVAAALALFATDAVTLWLGGGAPAVTAQIVVLLMVVQTITLTAVPAEMTLLGLGRARVVGSLAVVEGVSNLAISVALVSAHGAIGAAEGTLLTSAALSPIRLPLVCRALGVPLGRTLATTVVPALVRSLPGLAAMVAVAVLMAPGPARLVAGSAAGLGLCLAVGVAELGGPRRLAGLLRRPGAERAPAPEPG